jgi:hypothetical protein
MRNFGFALLLLFSQFGVAQSPKYRVLNIPVNKSGVQLRDAWCGGVNSPQFSAADLNNDGIKDLFIFDRVGDKVLTYLNDGSQTDTAFKYAPQYERFFPEDLASWATIKDYNKDGVPDIFTRVNAGTRVFKGFYDNGQLRFDLVSPLLLYNFGNFDVNIYTAVDDIPAFVDVNFDGDIDVLTFGVLGSFIEYFENQTVESGANVDSFEFLEGSLCWGQFAEATLTNSIALNVSCKGGGQDAPQASGQRHSGSTIYAFDDSLDHDIDLLLGDISYNTMMFVNNCYDSSYAYICKYDSTWPSCDVSANMPVFPGAYPFDADNDGIDDILIAPNARTGGNDVKNVLFYKNYGTVECSHRFNNNPFLIDQMLDFGTESKAVFFDFDGDSLQDIIVGNYGYFRQFLNYKSTLAVYRNTGTSTKPEFTLQTDDYNSFSSYNIVGINPAFGDLDGDGKKDLVIGETTGYLHFFKNTGGTTANYPTMTIPQMFLLDVGQFSAPFIYDINHDGLNDLLVGRKDGQLTYYRNFGTTTDMQFHKDSSNTFFGEINVTQPGYVDGFSQPFIMRDSAGNDLLFVGSNKGFVLEYLIDTSLLNGGSFLLIDSNYLQTRVGTKATMYAADITNDGKLEYVVGNSRGGLLMFSDSLLDTTVVISINPIEPNTDFLLYPNPGSQTLHCVLPTGFNSSHTPVVRNMLGEIVGVTHVQTADNSFVFDVTSLSNGIYFMQAYNTQQSLIKRFVIQR